MDGFFRTVLRNASDYPRGQHRRGFARLPFRGLGRSSARISRLLLILAGLLPALIGQSAHAQPPSLDTKVAAFLEAHRNQWNAWNVPFEDGKILHDLVRAGRFRNILEIGTSTGHSTIWLAWAAAKTGGKVVTIEIDPGRHAVALENFKQAGVEAYIDARLADAHDLVKQLPGPFDFIFNDADKEWYLNYFKDLDAKIAVGGCFTAHNTLRIYAKEVRDFLDYVRAKPNYRTRIERGSGEGISVSCKTRGTQESSRRYNPAG